MEDLSVAGDGISSTTAKAVVVHFPFLILWVWDVQITHTADVIDVMMYWRRERNSSVVE